MRNRTIDGKKAAAPCRQRLFDRTDAVSRPGDGFCVNGLTVRYDRTIVGPIDVSVAPGQVLGLIGPNGAGKTSFLNGVLGLVPASGQVVLQGEALRPGDRRLRREVGWAADEADALLPGEVTAQELWRLHAHTHTSVAADRDQLLTHADELADRLDFRPGRRLIRAFSHGMKKKTQLVAAFMHRPAILVLDEPRNGLDPLAGLVLEALVDEARARGGMIVLATHDLAYAQRRATHVTMLQNGRVILAGEIGRVCGPSDLEATFLAALASEADSTGGPQR